MTGYPPEDLLLRPGFLRAAARALERDRARDARDRGARRRPRTSTATSTTPARCCADGEVEAIYRKRFLPNYGVFDEERYFQPGREPRAARAAARRSSA